MKVMIYTFSNTTRWWRHIASRLEFASDTVLVSDLDDADVDLSPAFNDYMRQQGIEQVGLNALGVAACDEIVGRCRLLRLLDRSLALRMIGAMWRTIEDLLDRERPGLFLGFIVDRYILDLFGRALARRDIHYAGIAIGVLPSTFMFTSRGEHTVVREPSDDEVEAAVATLAHPEFVPNYANTTRFGLRRFVKTYARFTTRWLVFEALRLIRGRPYDYRYLVARWPKGGFRVRLSDWRLMSYLRGDWRDAFNQVPAQRRIFVALSVNPEAAIEYWVRDLRMVDYVAVLGRLASVLTAAGFHLFVKDHPSQFGFRQLEVFSSLAKHEGVTFVPYDVPARGLIEECRATFTWTGTVGLQAAVAGKCAVVDVGAYYAVPGLFLTLGQPKDIDRLPERLANFQPSLPLPEARRALMRHLLRMTVPGDYMSWRGFTPTDPEHIRRAETLVGSLNRYLPVLAKRVAD